MKEGQTQKKKFTEQSAESIRDWSKHHVLPFQSTKQGTHAFVATPEGIVRAEIGDYIEKDDNGNFKVIKK